MFIFQESLTDISFPYRFFFFSVFVCFLKRSHILACGQIEGLSKWREYINAKMIRESSLQCLDVAASLCRSVPSPCTEGALQSCSLCSLWQWFEAQEAWCSHKESALFLCPVLTIPNRHTSSLCVLNACRTPLLLVQKSADLSHNGLFEFQLFFSRPSL